jgi:hypothetical protein
MLRRVGVLVLVILAILVAVRSIASAEAASDRREQIRYATETMELEKPIYGAQG